MFKSKLKSLRIAPTIFLALLVVAMTGGSAFAAGSSLFVQRASHRSFAQTVGSLKQAVSSNGMMVMGHIDQQKALTMIGLHLAGAEAFFIGNPVVGKKLFTKSPAVGAVVPLRIYVWEAGGESHVGYFQPSALMSAIDPKLEMAGKMLDMKFARILKDTIH